MHSTILVRGKKVKKNIIRSIEASKPKKEENITAIKWTLVKPTPLTLTHIKGSQNEERKLEELNIIYFLKQA